MTAASSLQISQLCVDQSGKSLLVDIQAQLSAGQLIAICGPNGAGKSTLLSVIAGSRRPTAGSVILNGRPVPEWQALDLARRRSVLSQHTSLAFGFIVSEVVALGRVPHEGLITPGENRTIVAAAMDLMEITPLASRNILTLSGGEQQRVHLARILAQVWAPPAAGGAGWILLDEPTNALDLRYQIKLMRVLRDFADRGWGVVTVLHDLAMVRRWTDSCLLLNGGRLARVGPPQEVLSLPHIAQVYQVDQADLAALIPL